jgi:membrane-associated HD superfamily phosphohydrolase
MRKLTTALLTIAVLAVCAVPAVASGDDQAAKVEAVADRLSEMKDRLQLTPDQTAAIKPLLEDQVAKFKEVRSGLGDGATFSAKRDAAKQVKALSDDFAKKVNAILTPEQQAEWKKIRAENKDRMKAAIKARRAGAS